MAKILVTNGGPHSADNWAMATAEQIVQIDPAMAGDRLLAAEKLKLAIAEAISPHHADVQAEERGKLAADAKYVLTAPDATAHCDRVIKDILAAAKGTPWQPHFFKQDVQAVIREVVESHFHSSQHVERLWHADNNPDCPHAQSYKQYFTG